ncbi:MAG: DUF3367 domain-containing protein, partial [Aldersonia sp.]|nr:DUF3367 domain-containing protein [Aldersonia sp.]
GMTRDEPLQALASTPWAVRDAVPLTPPGAIRALDSVQRLIADGRPSAGLAPTLLNQGIGYVVLRNDLDPDTSRSTRPVLVHQAIAGSPGLTRVAEFGDAVGSRQVDGFVSDGDLRASYPAIEIFRVDGGTGTGPYLADVPDVPIVAGGPESLQRLAEHGARGPTLLAADAARAGLPVDEVTVTDTPTYRETDFGQVDNHSSALRSPGDERRTHNLVADYPVDGAGLVEGEWSGARITTSSSAADATQLGGAAPGSGAPATIDGDEATSWLSNGLESAVGQWVRLDLDQPIRAGLLHITVSPAAIGTPVKWMEVQTARGSTAARVGEAGRSLTVALPPGETSWIRILATQTEDGSVGSQFGITELSLDDYANPDFPVPVEIRHRTVLPPTPAEAEPAERPDETGAEPAERPKEAGAEPAAVRGWDLGQELPGRSGCVDAPDRVRCANGLTLQPEEFGTFQRTLSVPAPATVRPSLTVRARPGPALDALLAEPGRPIARAQSDTADPRGSALAATDGDERTTWTAQQDTVRTPGGPKPTLTLELPQPQLVTGLELSTSLGAVPAKPTSVAVNLGDGPQVREVGDGPMALHPRVTDRIEISIQTWESTLDVTALGFAQPVPPGFAEVTALGYDGQPIGAPSNPERPVTVSCADGPIVSVAGTMIATSV